MRVFSQTAGPEIGAGKSDRLRGTVLNEMCTEYFEESLVLWLNGLIWELNKGYCHCHTIQV